MNKLSELQKKQRDYWNKCFKEVRIKYKKLRVENEKLKSLLKRCYEEGITDIGIERDVRKVLRMVKV